MIDGKYEYFAFISYKEEDSEWAKWLQQKLEHYKLPTSLRKENPDLPERVSPIYEYKSEAGGGRLKEVIWKGLTSSKYLILICSPRATKSEWLNNGIRYFVESGQEENIIPFIVEGKPKSENFNEECFPSELLNLTDERELRGININELGRDAAAVKVVSRMFNVKFDSLWQRYEREQRRKRWIWGCLAVFTALVGIMVALFFIHQNNMIQEKDRSMLESQSRAIAEKIHTLIEEGDLFTAQLLALEILPDPDSDSPRPYTPEAETALRDALAPMEIDGFKQVSRIRGELGWCTDITMSKIEDAAYFINGGFVYKHYLPTGEERQFESTDVRNRFGSLGLLDDSPIYLNKEETKLCTIDYADEKSIYYIWDTQNGNLLRKGEFNTSEMNIDNLNQLLLSLDNSFIYEDVDNNLRMQIEDLPLELHHLINDEYEYIEAFKSISSNYIIVQGKVYSREIRHNLLAETRTLKYMPTTIEFSKDNKFLAIGDESGNISVIDLNTLKKTVDFRGPSIPIQNLDFSDDGTMLFEFACDSARSELLIYNLCGEVLSSIKEEQIIRIASVDWGKGLLTTVYDSQNDTVFYFKSWEFKNFQFHPFMEFEVHDNESMELWSPIWESTNSLLFLSDEGLTVNRLDTNNNKLTKACATPMYTMGNGQDFIMDIQPIDNERMILVASQGDHQVMDRKSMEILYPIRHGGLEQEREDSHIQQYVATYCVPQNSSRLLTLSYGGVLRIHDIKTGLTLQLLKLPCNVALPYLSSAAISHDGSIVAYCYEGEYLQLTKLSTLETLIEKTKASLKGRKLTSKERRKYYLE